MAGDHLTGSGEEMPMRSKVAPISETGCPIAGGWILSSSVSGPVVASPISRDPDLKSDDSAEPPSPVFGEPRGTRFFFGSVSIIADQMLVLQLFFE